jgi:1,4-dihydroxy-2-naphthoyl-CoA synthase
LASVAAMGFGDALRYAIEVNTLARTTDDLKEGVAAFLEKREPSWKR